MMLFERMMQNPEEGARIAAEFAEYQRNDQDSDRGQIGEELAAILNRRQCLLATLEQLAEEHSQWQTAFEDFAGIGEQSQRQSTFEEQAAQINAEKNRENSEYVNTTQEIKAKIRMLNRFACQLCSALYSEGITLTGGQISRLTRLGMSKSVRVRLDLLKKDKITVLPPKERLTEQDAAVLFKGMAAAGLISTEKGQFEAFCGHFGQVDGKRPKPSKTVLKWLGTPKQFAYFLWRVSQYMQREDIEAGNGYTSREKAICRAFGFGKKTRENSIRKYIQDFRNKPLKNDEQYNAVAKAINDLPGWNKTKEDGTQDDNRC